jgi:mannose-6-phosphate isomerase-like protein (cupin superfamily)
MRARSMSQEEMESTRLARFDQLPLWGIQESGDFPVEVRDMFVARRLWGVVCPDILEGSLKNPAPIRDMNDFIMNIAMCPPGQGPGLHHHLYATETYFCLEGRFRAAWGALGEHETVLEKWDTLSVPPGVIREFQNVGETDGYLQIILSGDVTKMKNDSALTPERRVALREAFGDEMLARIEATGRRFDAGVE